jgi:hypothetical protein
MVTNDQYLAGDQPVLYIRSLGSDLKEGAPVNYSVRVAVGDEEYEKDLTGTAFESIPFSLPALKAGVYQITVTGKSGSMSDTLTRSFKVLNSFMTQEKIDHYLLNPQTKIVAATDTPVTLTLTFTDYYRSQYLAALCRLSQVDGSRIEQKLGSRIARQLGNEYFSDLGTFGQEQKDFDPSGYQTPQEGSVSCPMPQPA